MNLIQTKTSAILAALVASSAVAAGLAARPAAAQARPKLIIESPSKGQTMKPVVGLGGSAVVVKWRVENFRLAALAEDERPAGQKQPAMARAEAAEAPGEGHLHVTVDNAPWFFVHTSKEPIVVAGFSPGSHKITLELVDREHESLDPPERTSFSLTVAKN